MRRRSHRSPAVALVALLALAGCGGGKGTPAGVGDDRQCGPDTEEPLDPGSVTHLLPGAPEPTYSSDPPTSGPHLAGGAPSGARNEPVARPAQVALLEAGGVMLQYKNVSAADLRRLRTLSGRQVVVAPNPGLRAPVIATAWRHSMRCGSASGGSLDAVARFVEAHRGKGPEH